MVFADPAEEPHGVGCGWRRAVVVAGDTAGCHSRLRGRQPAAQEGTAGLDVTLMEINLNLNQSANVNL
jgi:hypothetical protein